MTNSSPPKGPDLMESIGMIKDALPTAGPIVKWLADPNAPDLDPNTITDDDKLRFQKFASLFIGQFRKQKRKSKNISRNLPSLKPFRTGL
ncbi:MAG: hypothetical protein LRY76_01620 [Alphaproteobacteria bacterium]|nr:hypothetical protein [Alphaproteobacteria bacterium]